MGFKHLRYGDDNLSKYFIHRTIQTKSTVFRSSKNVPQLEFNQMSYLLPLNDLQLEIMEFIDNWCKTQKIPIPMREIKTEMTIREVSETRIARAVRGLVKKRFIRKSVDRSSRSAYVQLRKI